MKYWWREVQLGLAERLEDRALHDLRTFRRSLQYLKEDKVLRDGLRRAEAAARRAWLSVPAYRAFLEEHGVKSPDVPFEQLPVMDKNNYVRAYPTEQRCIGGSFLAPGVAIDESAGSTGIPYNWVRGIHERRRTRRELARLIDWAMDERPRISINGFSMGAWGTGVNIGEALELHGVVKSTGPDLEKILNTLEFFGPKPGYFITGYPPFLKLVLDSMLQRGFAVDEYELHALVGGEGMSEEFRRYLLRQFKSCYSGYGASDLEMGIATETPESIQIRGLLNDNVELRKTLLDGDHRVPMVFQYNPATYYIEISPQDEVICTLNYSKVLSPRVRYNIGDEGRLFKRGELLRQLRELGHPTDVDPSLSMPFPFLFLFGRLGQTISLMGANIYAEDMERVIYAQAELAKGYASFLMSVQSREDGSMYPRLCIEWSSDTPPDLPLADLANRIEKALIEINADFRDAFEEYADALQFEVLVYGYAQGPFAERGRRIKNRYLAKD